MKLLVLDLDGTITKSDNIVRFSLFMIKSQKQLKFLLFFPLIFLLKFRLIDNRKFKILYAKWILNNLVIQTLNENVTKFLKTKPFQTGFNSDVLNFIQKYSNSEKVILSANYSFLVVPISKVVKIQNHISIELETKGNKYTGKTIGYIPYGIEKINAIKPLLAEKNHPKTIGLADSKSDIPLLKYLDEGYLLEYKRRTKKIDFERI